MSKTFFDKPQGILIGIIYSMLQPSKFSLAQCSRIQNFVDTHPNILNISFYGYIKSYPDNSRITLSSDPNYLQLYFDLQHYSVDWINYKKALDEFGGMLGTWQFCQEDHKCCKIWQEHQKESDIILYLWIYFRYENYSSFHVFGLSSTLPKILTESSDRELTVLLNNAWMLRRFIQKFKADNHEMLSQAEKHKYKVNQFDQKSQHDEYQQYWGEYIQSINAFKQQNLPERIYLTGKFENVFLTRHEAIMLHAYYHGSSYKDIAIEHSLSVRTIEKKFSEIKYKLGATSKLDLLKICLENEIITILDFSI